MSKVVAEEEDQKAFSANIPKYDVFSCNLNIISKIELFHIMQRVVGEVAELSYSPL